MSTPQPPPAMFTFQSPQAIVSLSPASAMRTRRTASSYTAHRTTSLRKTVLLSRIGLVSILLVKDVCLPYMLSRTLPRQQQHKLSIMDLPDVALAKIASYDLAGLTFFFRHLHDDSGLHEIICPFDGWLYRGFHISCNRQDFCRLWYVNRRFRNVAAGMLYACSHFHFRNLSIAFAVLHMFAPQYLQVIQSIGFKDAVKGGLAFITTGRDFPAAAMTSLRTVMVACLRPRGHAKDQRRFDIQFPQVEVQWLESPTCWPQLWTVHYAWMTRSGEPLCGLRSCFCRSLRKPQRHRTPKDDRMVLKTPRTGTARRPARSIFESFQSNNQLPFSPSDLQAIQQMEQEDGESKWADLYDKVSDELSSSDSENYNAGW
jgi:hypothetical protein